jgi:hypothetical protein
MSQRGRRIEQKLILTFQLCNVDKIAGIDVYMIHSKEDTLHCGDIKPF